jgi:hypothetical protein
MVYNKEVIMKWYVASLLIKSRVGDDHQAPYMCDEQVRLIKASDAEEAYNKALKIGHEEEQTYLNGDGETVYWEFEGLINLEEFDEEIEDGVEIRSKLFDNANPAKLVSDKDHLAVFLALNHQKQLEAGKV